jgi:serine/threonine protein kinase
MAKNNKHAQWAGALMGQGAYGCTFLPAVPCADKSGKPHPIKPNRIGKVFGRYESAAEELVFARIVKKIDPQQRLFYYPDESCFTTRQDVQRHLVRGETCAPMKALPANENKAVELLMPNGGQTLTDYLKTKGVMSRAAMAAILERLFFGVRRLLEAGYVHQDLKTPNIVAFAGPNGKHEVRIIDFGNISSFADFYHGDTNFMMEGHRYFVNPPEYRIPLKLDDVRLQIGSNGTSIQDFDTVVAKIVQIETRILEIVAIPDIQAAYRVGYTSAVQPQPDYIQHNVMALERFCAMFDGLDYDGRMKVLEGMNAASKADMWSMGTIMILLDRYLIPAAQDDAEAVNIYVDMVSGLLQPNPAERMSIDEALRLIRRLKKTGILGSPVQNDHYHEVFPLVPPKNPARVQHPLRPSSSTRPMRTQRQLTPQQIVASNQPHQTRKRNLASQGTQGSHGNQASKTSIGSPTPKTKLTIRLKSSTVRELRASELYKGLAVPGKSRFKKDELIRAIVKDVHH